MVIDAAQLQVGVGGGSIGGAISFANAGRLVSQNAGALTVTPAFDPTGSILQATTGGTLTLSETSYVAGANGSQLLVTDVGSALNLSSITTFSGGTFSRTNVQATSGGLVNLSGLTSITVGATTLDAIGAGSVINLSALRRFQGTISPTVVDSTSRAAGPLLRRISRPWVP